MSRVGGGADVTFEWGGTDKYSQYGLEAVQFRDQFDEQSGRARPLDLWIRL